MTSEKPDEVTVPLRIASRALLTTPTGEFRRRAWRTFQQALDRHLTRKRRLSVVRPPR